MLFFISTRKVLFQFVTIITNMQLVMHSLHFSKLQGINLFYNNLNAFRPSIIIAMSFASQMVSPCLQLHQLGPLCINCNCRLLHKIPAFFWCITFELSLLTQRLLILT